MGLADSSLGPWRLTSRFASFCFQRSMLNLPLESSVQFEFSPDKPYWSHGFHSLDPWTILNIIMRHGIKLNLHNPLASSIPLGPKQVLLVHVYSPVNIELLSTLHKERTPKIFSSMAWSTRFRQPSSSNTFWKKQVYTWSFSLVRAEQNGLLENAGAPRIPVLLLYGI